MNITKKALLTLIAFAVLAGTISCQEKKSSNNSTDYTKDTSGQAVSGQVTLHSCVITQREPVNNTPLFIRIEASTDGVVELQTLPDPQLFSQPFEGVFNVSTLLYNDPNTTEYLKTVCIGRLNYQQ